MGNKTLLLAFLLFLSGCGAVITGVGVVISGSSSGTNALNNAPTVLISSPSANIEKNDLITLGYKLVDPESNPANIVVEWKTNQGTWKIASELTGNTTDTSSDGTMNLSSSPAGIDHNFVWNSLQDIMAANLRGITLRITPTDITTGQTGSSAEVTFDVMNNYSTTVLGRLQKGKENDPYQPLFLWYDFNNKKKIYITNKKTNTITSLDLDTGAKTRELGTTLTPYNGDNLLGTLTNLNSPSQMDLGLNQTTGELSIFFCDTFNHRIRVYNLTTKFITTLAGNGAAGYDEDTSNGGLFNDPQNSDLNTPYGLHSLYDSNGLKGLCFSERGNGIVRYINFTSVKINFYNGVQPIEFGGLTPITIQVRPNEMRTIAGNFFYFNDSNDGPIWTRDNTQPVTNVATFRDPTCVRLVTTPVSNRPLLYVVDHRRIRVINLSAAGAANTTYIYPGASIPFSSVGVDPGYAKTILGDVGGNTPGVVNFLTDNAFAPRSVSQSAIQHFILSPHSDTSDTYDIYFTETFQNSIWKIDGETGLLTRVVGDGFFGEGNSQGDLNFATDASLAIPVGLTATPNFLIVADHFTSRIRAVNFGTVDHTIAGKTIGPRRIDTIAQGPTTESSDISEPEEIVVDPDTQDLYISDLQTHRILKFNVISRVGEPVVGNGIGGSAGDGGPAKNASIGFPVGFALFKTGSDKMLLVGDNGNFTGVRTTGKVRLVNLGTASVSFGGVNNLASNNIQTLVGGGGTIFTNTTSLDTENVAPGSISLGKVIDVMVDTPASGKSPGVYILDQLETKTVTLYRLLVYNPNTDYPFQFNINTTGGLTIRTVNAGSVSALAIWRKNPGDFNPLTLQYFNSPARSGLSGGARNDSNLTNLFVVLPLIEDSMIIGINYSTNGALKVVNTTIPAGTAARMAGVIPNSGNPGGYNGDNQQAKMAMLNRPHGIIYSPATTQNPQEVLVIADTDNHRIRLIFGSGAPTGKAEGEIVTFVGNGQAGYNGETLPASNTILNKPTHVGAFRVINVEGKPATLIFIAEEGNSRIRLLSTVGN